MMSTETGVLWRHLPAIYQANPTAGLENLLAVFERTLLGTAEAGEFGDGREAGLAQKIAEIATLFSPELTPREFLPWLSQWVALSQGQGLPEVKQRQLIAESVALYTRRGTKAYVHRLLRYFLPEGVVVDETDIHDHGLQGLTVGESKLGVDSLLGGDQPFCFAIKIGWAGDGRDAEETKRLRRRSEAVIRAVVDLAKPAHTSYQLQWKSEESRAGNGLPGAEFTGHLSSRFGWQQEE